MLVLRTFQDPHYEARYTLSGRVYVFRFAHNARLDRWYLSVFTESEQVVATNRKLVVGVRDLLDRVTNGTKPPGRLLVVPTSAGIDSPRLADMGDEYALIYLDPAELLAN